MFAARYGTAELEEEEEEDEEEVGKGREGVLKQYFYVPSGLRRRRGIIAFTCIGVSLPLWSFQ